MRSESVRVDSCHSNRLAYVLTLAKCNRKATVHIGDEETHAFILSQLTPRDVSVTLRGMRAKSRVDRLKYCSRRRYH